LFEGIALDSAVFRGRRHDELIGQFKLALEAPSAVVVLTGQPGVGKTTTTSAALRGSETRVALAWLNGLITNATELVELLLAELGIATEGTTRVERMQLWRQFQSEMRATDSRVFVIAERADDLPVEVLRALDGLTAPDPTGFTGANVVLLGQAGLEDLLAAPPLESLKQRVRLKAKLDPLTEGELQDYLRHQLRAAGGDYDRVFAPDALAALHRHTGGVLRLANTLCETALVRAATEKAELVTAELIDEVAANVLGLAGKAPEADTARAPEAPVVVAPSPTPAVGTAPAPAPAAAAPPVPAPAVAKAPTSAPAAAAPAAAAPAVAPVSVAAPSPVAPARVAAAAPAAPLAPAAPASAPVAAPAAAAPAAPSAPAAPRTVAPAPAPVATAPEFEYDGEATEVPDVSIVDFPVLTDAVDDVDVAATTPPAVAPAPVTRPLPPPSPKAAPAAPTAPAALTKPAPANPAASRPVPTRPPAPAAPAPQPATPPPTAPRRIETAFAAPQAPRVAATTPAAPQAAAPPHARKTQAPATPPPRPSAPPEIEREDDAFRQTQTLLAISSAKSIDEISNSMAETLFGDAELDLLTAALAAASEDASEAEDVAPPPRMSAPVERPPAPTQRTSRGDDLLDLLDLTSDAPLELIDDSHAPPGERAKTAARR
jgi:type II secretory pathway predicted ATPase ExeA